MFKKMARNRKSGRTIKKWIKSGSPIPPPQTVKQAFLFKLFKKYSLKTFVETGTYLGDTTNALKDYFNKLYTIELSEDLYKKAVERFSEDPHIKVLQGDSGKVLKTLITRIDEPTLFWLDGHYSAGITAQGEKDTPIFEELECILSEKNYNPKHIILIDDARCFGAIEDYPEIEDLRKFVTNKQPAINLTIEADSIRLIHNENLV